ncbi:CDK5 and ABL1 enzyme substrate 1-like [Clupea harengus]|uniref:CDK5 and ABL1 enzyme substrate 1-like n=1 Tax=Clupea harengus TaxID=7950 RepID=A0A8M1KAS3_CLUHA|nr:CDK5 and ABL1 enzyme substrate 1-like [Clupea harengus]
MTTHQQYSSITTAIVHSSGAEDQTWSDSVPTSLPVDQESMDSEAQAASDISSLLHRHPPRKIRFETLPDIEENAPLRRFNSSSFPRPKSSKRVHFIKNLRQHDTSDGRIILITVRRALCRVFSLIPYRDYSHIGDVTLESGHQQPSGAMATKEMVIGLEGVELGTKGKVSLKTCSSLFIVVQATLCRVFCTILRYVFVVSYTQLLYPTHALSRHCPVKQQSSSGPVYPPAPCGFHGFHPIKSEPSVYVVLIHLAGADSRDCRNYDPNLLDDPLWPCGKHKRVLVFRSYMTTVIEYTKPSDLKRDMNKTFREKFPHIRLTLSKIRSLKKEIRKVAQEDCGYEEPTVAMAFVYFEKLALRGKVDKQNRKLCAGACILLAAKMGSDLKRFEVRQLLDRLEERLRLSRRELLAFEFPVLVALEFNLHLPDHELLPHCRRLLQTT